MKKRVIVNHIIESNKYLASLNAKYKYFCDSIPLAFYMVDEQDSHEFAILISNNLCMLYIDASEKSRFEIVKYNSEREFLGEFPYLQENLTVAKSIVD